MQATVGSADPGSTVAAAHGGTGKLERGFNQYVAERGNFCRDLGQSRNAQHVAQHDADVLALLESRQAHGRLRFRGAAAKAPQPLAVIIASERAVQRLGAGEAGQQIGILNKRFAEILAVSKDGDGVIHQERPPVKQLKQLA